MAYMEGIASQSQIAYMPTYERLKAIKHDTTLSHYSHSLYIKTMFEMYR